MNHELFVDEIHGRTTREAVRRRKTVFQMYRVYCVYQTDSLFMGYSSMNLLEVFEQVTLKPQAKADHCLTTEAENIEP